MSDTPMGLQRDAISRVLLDKYSDYSSDVKAMTLNGLLDAVEGLTTGLENATKQLADEVATREMLADILTRTAAALKGPPPPLTRHNWADLPEVAARLVSVAPSETNQ